MEHPTKPKRKSHSSSQRFTAMDRELISACRDGKNVSIEYMGFEDERFTCKIESVDRYFIKIIVPAVNRDGFWINKSLITSAMVNN